MFCANCGNKLPDQAKFCAKCGQPVEPKAGSSETGSRPAAGASASRSGSSGDEKLYNPGAEYGGQKKKGGKDLGKRARGTLYAGRVLVPISFVLLIISCFVPALTFGATAYGYRYFRAPGMLHSWLLYIWRAVIKDNTFNITFWIIIGLIAVAVILPVFFVKSNRKGSGWIILGCVLLWVLFLVWILCVVQLNSRGLTTYTVGTGYYLLGAAVVLDTIGTAMYRHRSY